MNGASFFTWGIQSYLIFFNTTMLFFCSFRIKILAPTRQSGRPRMEGAPVGPHAPLTAEIPTTELLIFPSFAPVNIWSIGVSVAGRRKGGGGCWSPERKEKNWHFHSLNLINSPLWGRGWMYPSPSFPHPHHLFSPHALPLHIRADISSPLTPPPTSLSLSPWFSRGCRKRRWHHSRRGNSL